MQRTIEALFEGGVLHPLEPLALKEHQRVIVTVFDHLHIPENHPLLMSADAWSDAASEDIPLEEVRHLLAPIEGSLSQTVIDERRDR